MTFEPADKLFYLMLIVLLIVAIAVWQGRDVELTFEQFILRIS